MISADDRKKLRENLASAKAEIRKKALVELKKLPTPEAIEMLISGLAEKSNDVQADLTKTLMSYKDAALPFLVKAFSNPSWQVRRGASRIIASLGEGALSRFLELIPANEEDVDFWMVETLSIMGGQATNYLVHAFRNVNSRIQLAAIRAAANVKDPKIVPSLLTMLEEKDWPVRKAAFDSLISVHHLNQHAVLAALKKSSPEAKYWVIKLAAERHDPELIPLYQEIVEQDPEESKIEAIRALAHYDSREVQKILVGFLAHRSWIIRKTAAEAIWQQGLGASEELLSAVQAPNIDARYWSVKLLGKTHEPKAFAKIMDCLTDQHPSVRAAACQALGTFGDKRALAPLMTLLSDPAEEVRTTAILAISQIGEKDVLSAEKSLVPTHLLAENQVTCSHCKKMVGRDFTFCPFCLGHLRPHACRKCGRAMESTWKGCPNCGEPSM